MSAPSEVGYALHGAGIGDGDDKGTAMINGDLERVIDMIRRFRN